MSTELLQATRLLIDAINTAQAVGVDFAKAKAVIDRARTEGRDITEEEIQQLAAGSADALAELDSAIAARKGEPQA